MRPKKPRLKPVFTLIIILLIQTAVFAQGRFPGKSWDKAGKPEDLGYSSEKLEAAKKYTETIQTAAVMIIVDGIVLSEWGETAKKYLTHSCR